MPATLSIVDLRLSCHLGVPDLERRRPQKLLCTAVFPVSSLAKAVARDELRHTVDYHALSNVLQAEARRIPRKLLERLATDLARAAFRRFRIPWIELELKKFILPQTRHVSLRVRFARTNLR
ncbi:MAG: dihydroneopterin aldolase [Verrucomicrobia bacterium]|nr:dihydroneopterin aldolase [Verrucomicrobiota bacterium]